MSEVVKKSRPEFRNIHAFRDLPSYRWPLASLASGAHRFSGLFIFLLLPFILYLLDLSLTSETTFDYLAGFTSGWFVKLVILALAWAYLHHFCAGIRFLFLDFHVGLDKDSGRKTAAAVFAVSLPLAALVGLKLFGVF
ncbi:MAG: succinate dehydrogenase, cytochrome b556 subunit [Burkholderiaceae bacterium]